MIAKKTVIQDIKLADFPEEIDEQNNIKVYGEPVGKINWLYSAIICITTTASKAKKVSGK